MNITSFFLDRPVSAIILNIMIVIVGYISITQLTIREYPKVEVPEISVVVNYPNVDVGVVETSVTNVLEDALADVEGVDIMQSYTTYGHSQVTLQVKYGQSMAQALSQVKEMLAKARWRLPNDIKEPTIHKFNGEQSWPPFLGIVVSADTLNAQELYHFATTSIINNFRGIVGVAQVGIWNSSKYNMVISPDPRKLYAHGINIGDIKASLKRNYDQPAGRFQDEVSATLATEKVTVNDFENSIIHGKRPIILKDLARIALERQKNTAQSWINGKNALIIGINKTTDSNALEVASQVRAKVLEVQQQLPDHVKVQLVFDRSQYIKGSLHAIYQSIIEAIVLVSLILWLFLGNIRLSLIPIVTIPISLIGVFYFVQIMGFSINIFTLLAVILSVGLVVDDAIVVIENIYQHLEKGLSWQQAVRTGCHKISFTIIAMTLTLISVFIPIAFIPDTTGQIFREFALTLAMSVAISGVVALSLSPVMANLLLNSKQNTNKVSAFIKKIIKFYTLILSGFITKKRYLVITFGVIFGLAIVFAIKLPRQVIPKEDRGVVFVHIPRSNSSLDELEKAVKEVNQIVKAEVKGIKHIISKVHPYSGQLILVLKDQSQRIKSAEEITQMLRDKFKDYPSFDIYAYSISTGFPNITAGGGSMFDIVTIKSCTKLYEVVENFTAQLREKDNIQSAMHFLRLNDLSYKIIPNKINLITNQVSFDEISNTLRAYFGGMECGQFTKDKIAYPIVIRTDYEPEDLGIIYVTNSNGEQIALDNVCTIEEKFSTNRIYHRDQMLGIPVHIDIGRKQTIAAAMEEVRQLSTQLPEGFSLKWSGMAKLYQETSYKVIWLIFMAIIFVYMILAMQFESFIDPLIIISTIPLGFCSSLLGVFLTNTSANIFTAIGIVTLIGLITKHGILLVEFGNQAQKEGQSLINATLQAAKQRFRPILMTTVSTVIGALPLVIFTTTGGEIRQAIGIVIVTGLSIGTIFTLFITPCVYYFIKKAVQWQLKR